MRALHLANFASFRRRLAQLSLAITLAMPAGLMAAPNLSDNFDSYAPNTGGTGWSHSITATSPESAFVGVTDADSFGGPHSLTHRIDPGTATTQAFSSKTFDTPVALNSTGSATLSMKVKLGQTNTTTAITILDDVGNQLPRISFTNIGTVWAYNDTGSTNVTNMGTYSANRWYELTITLELPTSSTSPATWGATLTDLSDPDATPLSTTGRTYFQPPAAGATTLSRVSIGTTFGANLGPSVMYFDDIVVQVPEPAALAGISVAGGALMVRRRRV